MTDAEFMGRLIAAVSIIVSILVATSTLIIIPVIKLNKTITKIDMKLDNNQKDIVEIKADIKKHDDRIDDHEGRLSKVEGRIGIIK